MFINHKKAKSTFNRIVLEDIPNWIVLSGGDYTGKTSFVKEVCRPFETFFCDPQLSIFYLDGFIKNSSIDFLEITKNYLCKNNYRMQILKKRYNYCFDYINDITKDIYKDIMYTLIKIDIAEQKFDYAEYLGNILQKKFNYIVLEDFHKCDLESYAWLLTFSEHFLKGHKYIIVICNFEKKWNSLQIREIFHEVPVLIDIKKFDSAEDYFDVLKEKIYFENLEYLKQLSFNLFEIYGGDAQLLFKTIYTYEGMQAGNDYDKQKTILQIAHNLSCNTLKDFNNIDKLIIGLIALSPINLSISELSNILDMSEKFVKKVIIKHYNNHLLKFCTNINDSKIYYVISDSHIRKMIAYSTDSRTKDFLLTRLYNLEKSGYLNIPILSKIELAFEIASEETEELLNEYLNTCKMELSIEDKIIYIDRLYSLNLHYKHRFSNYENAKILYEYGFLETAFKMSQYLLSHCQDNNYDLLMLLGGIQHLLLLPEAPVTFQKAANLPDITVSQKLSAINRQIMSLNQANQASAIEARKLYDLTFEAFENEKCNGLIELYRNTNNSYPLDVALEYTMKGYNLAIELENELEQYKCLHNISMIKLHQNCYNLPVLDINMDIKSSFELVDKFFAKNSQHYHRRAYPLLDLGTYEMFQYIISGQLEDLKNAKAYFSKAQLFAKSFYARHIAEISLLITNTHLYYNDKKMVAVIKKNRAEIYQKYSSCSIVDYRVNRKILLSLAASATLTKNLREAKRYLSDVEKYLSDSEMPRYNNLCLLCENINIDLNNFKTKEQLYYGYPYFVPWLISLGH